MGQESGKIFSLEQELANFSIKNQRVSYLGFLRQEVKSRLSCRFLYDKRENSCPALSDPRPFVWGGPSAVQQLAGMNGIIQHTALHSFVWASVSPGNCCTCVSVRTECSGHRSQDSGAAFLS